MSRSAISFGVFVVTIFVGAIGYSIYGVFESADEAAMMSCTFSVRDAILSSKNVEVRELIEAGDDWRMLNSNEAAMLVASVDVNKRFDCFQRFTRPEGGRKPPEDIEIWVKRERDKKLQVSVHARR